MDFGPFGTSFTKFGTFFIKFGTSNPWATKTPILLPMVHLFLWGIFGKWLEVVLYFETDFGTLGISMRKFDTSNPWSKGHLSLFLRFISSFGDPQEVIGGHFPPWNGLWHSWYIIYKIWYTQSLSYQDPYLLTHGLFIHLGIFGMWLKVVPYSEMDFETLGTFLRKFDTSNPWANGTPISFPMVHFFLWRPLGSDWRLFPTSEWTLATLVRHLQNLVHLSQNLVHP